MGYDYEIKLRKERRDYFNVIAIDTFGRTIFDRICHEMGAKRDPVNGFWYLQNKRENMQSIFRKFKGKAWIDSTEFFGKKDLERQRMKRIGTAIVQNKDIPDYLNEYQSYLNERRYSEHTIKTYSSILHKLFSYFDGLDINMFSHRHLEEYNKDVILAENYSRVYQRQLISALKSFMRYHDLEFIVNSNLEYPRRERKLPVVLSKEEVQSIIDVTTNLKHRCMLVVLYSSGIRIGELLSIRLDDIDKNRGVLYIRNGKGAKDRQVQLARKTIEKIEEYERAYFPEWLLFQGQNGGKYSPRSVGAIIKRAAAKSKINKNISAHTFRHSYATHLLEAGVGLRYIQEILGHKSSKTTEIYTHISNQALSSIRSPIEDMHI